jgi:hypothetical protein
METVQMGHFLPVTPHCITHYRLWADDILLVEETNNHQSVREHRLSAPSPQNVRLEIMATAGALPAVYALNIR